MLANRAIMNLQQGLNDLEGNPDTEVMKAAYVLAKVHEYLGDVNSTLAILDHPKYGPCNLIGTLGPASETFEGDLRKLELKALVGQNAEGERSGQEP